MLTKHHLNPKGNQLFHHETDWSFWKDLFPIIVGHSLFPPHVWHFLIRRLVLNAPETRTRVGGTPTSLWCLCCSGWSLCWTSPEPEREELTGAQRCKGQGQHAPPVSEHPEAAQLCLKVSSFRLSTSYSIQNAFEKKLFYIMLFCCDVLHLIMKLRSVCLWQKERVL